MKFIYKIILFMALISLLGTSACEKDIPPENNDPVVEDPEEISLFIYEGLKDVYLWYNRVDKLGNGYFDTTDDFYTYLNNFDTDFESLFYDLLYQYGTIDKWSWIVDDWEEMENSFAGISKSMGYDFRLVQIGQTSDIFGFVRYVLPDSPAEDAGLERGNLFLKVNGEQITVNNYMDLLINNESYYLTLATISDNTIYEGDDTDVMNAVVLQENPVHYYDVLDVGGVPTGYLVYNAFTSDFDIQLNETFEYFSNQGVTRLILDLRYNGGGSIQTTIYLASMIYSTDDSEIFTISEWNDKYNAYWKATYGDDVLNYYFTDVIEETETTLATPISSLGITELYVITTSSTASASELLINGFEPYFDVKLIGTNTTGKYVGSITVKDYDNQGNINSSHKWAMQPIISQSSNVNYESEYYNGFLPDYFKAEDLTNLLPLGDENEILLKTALDLIKGIQPAKETLVPAGYTIYFNSESFEPYNFEMIDDYYLSVQK